MSGERDYITQEQQASQQPDVAQNTPVNERKPSKRKRLLQVGTLMATMLATGIGFIGAKSADHSKVKVEPQAQTDILNGIGSFDAGTPPPAGWKANAEATGIVPTLSSTIAVSGNSATVETNGTLPCQSNDWTTINSVAINPSNVYTLDFQAAYISSESPHGIDPKVTLGWKDSQGNPLSNPSDNPVLTGVNHADTWGHYTKTYGPGQNVTIPSNAAKVTIEIQGNVTDVSCTGKLYYDNLQLLGSVVPTPTPPPVSVGGVAEQVNPNDLEPIANNSGSNNTELEVVIGGIVIGSLAAGAAGWKIRSINREKIGK